MRIVSYDTGIRFTPHNEIMNELAMYGVITKGANGLCEILNPIYHYCILQAFKPLVNGLESEYLPETNVAGFQEYLTPDGDIDMVTLLNNFQDFIARAGFRVLQVPDTPQEFIGQHLLLAYLDQFVQLIGGVMYLEVQTGRGRMDLLIYHNRKKYIVETKIWEGHNRYQAGKKQLAAYLKLEKTTEGYYVVFDHRRNPEPRVETEMIHNIAIRSYVIPVVQERPSDERMHLKTRAEGFCEFQTRQIYRLSEGQVPPRKHFTSAHNAREALADPQAHANRPADTDRSASQTESQ